ncbi:MAG: prenyltransferase/squalene oxidase repeat-containing protein [Phycisphaerae bacterium]
MADTHRAAAPGLSDLDETLENTRQRLLEERVPAGHWEGRLATSALSTATASAALALVDADRHDRLIRGGLDWLAAHQNADGGWGDTTLSKSNLNTTSLCWAAFAMAPENRPDWSQAVGRAEQWLTGCAGSLEPRKFVDAILAFYGRDRTFSVPILTLLSLTGRLGRREEALRMLPQLPFELAAAPHSMWKWLRLPVVSYALPALVAIGQARHHFVPCGCPVKRRVRDRLRKRTLGVVQNMQSSRGGFLEATPLTSFVTACLASIGLRDHTIVRQAVLFLVNEVRPDGGWPIDTCLSTWVTTLSVNALADSGDLAARLPADQQKPILRWLLDQQYKYVHPFTHTPPGAWSWMDTDGAVPDSDDTPGALIALKNLMEGGLGDREETTQAAERGVRWLLKLQNRDGGVPTFCRGWGKLPFDRSAQDMTAHTLRAWACWQDAMPTTLQKRMDRAANRAVRFLARKQGPEGTWLPLWFGNEHMPDDENWTYGTGRVLTALAESGCGNGEMIRRGAEWLVRTQQARGGWSGGPGGPASLEETGVAVDALASLMLHDRIGPEQAPEVLKAIRSGASWLIEQSKAGREFVPAPIGFYFAKLWYYERMYPIVFPAAGLEKVRRVLVKCTQPGIDSAPARR